MNIGEKIEEGQRTAVADDKVPKLSGIDKSKLKRTNRISRSCSRCKKRKVKCNFEIPCDRCIARNQAHLCTRDPIVFDGLLISNDNTTELRYSQENEVLKKKIKELQDTIVKLKSVKNEERFDYETRGTDDPKNVTPTICKKSSSSNKKLSLNEVVLKPVNTENPQMLSGCKDAEWNTYFSTISLLKKGLANGLILDSSNNSVSEMNYNTEEWLRLDDKNFLKYDAEDSKCKCWLYELDLISELRKPTCDILIECGLKIVTLFPIINVAEFMKEYEEYWADDAIQEKQITALYTKSALNYLFISLMYGLMCFGVYQCDPDARMQLKFSTYDWDNYSKAFFSASLESLYRGRYMTHPNFKAIQIISILRILCGFLGGNTLSNNLTCVSFFLSYKLDIMKSEDELKVANFWNMLAYDWYDDQDRYLLSSLDYANNLPRLKKWIDKDKRLLNWPQYFLRFLVNVSMIKKEFYHDSVKLTLRNLKLADIELRFLKVESSRDLESYNQEENDNFPQASLQCLSFHVNSLIHHEILDVNLKLSTFLSCEEWSSNYYPVCYASSCEIIKTFTCPTIPLEYKSYPAICEHVLYASVFLIVDCMLNAYHMKNYKEVLRLVTQTLPIFQSFKSMVTGAIRGLYTIEKLLILLNIKRKERTRTLEATGTLNNKKADLYKAAKQLPETLQDKERVKIEQSAMPINVTDVRKNSVSSDEDSSSSDDSDMPLYTSTLNKKQKESIFNVLTQHGKTPQTFESNKQPNSENMEQTFSFATFREPEQKCSPAFNYTLNDRGNELNNASATSTRTDSNTIIFDSSASHPAMKSPLKDKLSPQPLIQNTIMDILEDSGWIQFINSIDDLGG